MPMDAIIRRFHRQFTRRGTFTFDASQRIRKAVRVAQVPEGYGAYLISGPPKRVLYIGRSGSMRKGGSFQSQTLRGRLTNRQGKLSRQQFFENILHDQDLEFLLFEWFVTFDETVRVLPCLAEAQLFQAYFEVHETLPPYNERV